MIKNIFSKLLVLLLIIIMSFLLGSCGVDKDYNTDDYETTQNYDNNDTDYSYDNDKSYSNNNYDYDKGYGYTEPKVGESFADYVKRQDPELYKSIEDRYYSLQ